MSQITVFHADSAAVVYTDKKGATHSISAEGALWKGGAALAGLKDLALDSALAKAMNGKYHSAVDILAGAFPAVGKAAVKLVGNPAVNKAAFMTLCVGVARAEPAEGKKLSLKQDKAQILARILRSNLESVTTVDTVSV
jgi:hypothetical protein